MTDNNEMLEEEIQHENRLESFFKDMMPLQQRQLVGTLVFFGIILVVGWVGINEPRRMETFTAQYDGRSIERGAVLYNANCASCHGADGRGLEGVAPALNSAEMFNGERLEEIGWSGTLYDYVEGTVAAGRPVMSGDWPQPMPTWGQEFGGPMREDQVRDVVNFVMNYGLFYEDGAEVAEPSGPVLPTEEPAFEPVGTDLTVELPEGDPARGEALFLGQEPAPDGTVLGCQSCHSLDGSVLVGPTVQGIANRELPEGYDSLEQYLHEAIVAPSAYVVPDFADAMPKNFGERLDAQALADMLAYLQTLE